MIVGLVTPADTSVRCNVGAHMITAGIRWLVRQALPEVRFVVIEMLHDDSAQWCAAMACDVLLICGNPRFSLSAEDAWWESGLWHRLVQAQMAGIRVIDAWSGACVGLDVEGDDERAAALEAIPRNRDALRWSRLLHARIARDYLTRLVYERASIDAVRLPCSSACAASEFGVVPERERHGAVIVLLAMDGHVWAAAALEQLASRLHRIHGKVEFLATSWDDLCWARSWSLPGVVFVNDPVSLLRIYAQSACVVSLRLHAAIPAASLGAAVLMLAVDSRADACEPFAIPVAPFTALPTLDSLPEPALWTAPSAEGSIGYLRRVLC